VAQGLGCVDVEVGWVRGFDGAGELADFLAADVICLCGRVAAPLQVRIDSHGFKPIVAGQPEGPCDSLI